MILSLSKKIQKTGITGTNVLVLFHFTSLATACLVIGTIILHRSVFPFFLRSGLCADRLVNFSMAVQTQTTDGINVRAYTYRDPGGPGQDVYTVIPSPRISSLVSEVRIDVGPGKDILTLCEVQVFGGELLPLGHRFQFQQLLFYVELYCY